MTLYTFACRCHQHHPAPLLRLALPVGNVSKERLTIRKWATFVIYLVLERAPTFASMRATLSGLHRSGKNWYSLSNALFASKSYVPDLTWKREGAATSKHLVRYDHQLFPFDGDRGANCLHDYFKRSPALGSVCTSRVHRHLSHKHKSVSSTGGRKGVCGPPRDYLLFKVFL